MTSVLLDTHALLWFLRSSDTHIGPQARACIEKAGTVYYSAASIWEIEIKRGTGKVHLDGSLDTALAAARLTELPVRTRHASAIGEVDLPHRDPFDRLLLTQASVEGLRFLTADTVLLGLGRPDVLDARR